jgi:hypothetical protein
MARFDYKRPGDEQTLEGGGSGGGFGPRTTLVPKLNKPAKEGYNYRSPNQTSGESVFPHPLEATYASQRADLGRIGRGLNAESRTERGRLMQQEAGGRALTRTGTRAGVAALGAEGIEAAREQMSNADKTKADAAKADADAASSNADQDVDTSSASPSAIRGYSTDTGNYKRGGAVKKKASGGMTTKVSSASKRGDGLAQRGKTKGRMC